MRADARRRRDPALFHAGKSMELVIAHRCWLNQRVRTLTQIQVSHEKRPRRCGELSGLVPAYFHHVVAMLQRRLDNAREAGGIDRFGHDREGSCP